MSNSEEQFLELLSQIVIRTNKMLNESRSVIPFGLTLTDINKLEIILAVGFEESVSDYLNVLQEQLKVKANNPEVVATAIVYANPEISYIEAFLENNENYCLKAIIPVKSTEQECVLVSSEIETENGEIYVFRRCGE